MTFNIFKRLLPNGRAWAIIAEKRLRQFFEGLAAGASDPVVKEFDDRFDDLNPQLTQRLAMWEDQFALPNTGLTEQERRDRLQGAWSATGGQSPRYIQDTLQAAGFDVYVHEWWQPGGTQQPAGESFTNLGALFSTSPLGAACSSDGVIVYVVDDGDDSLYRSADSGETFTNLGALFSTSPRSVACSSDGVIVYVTDLFGSQSLYRSADSGVSFTNLGALFSTRPVSVACSSDGVIVYVVDYTSDSIYRSADSGVSFTNLGTLFGGNPRSVACSSDGVIVYVMDFDDDSLYRSADSGTSFNVVEVFGGVPVSVACSSDGVIVYVTNTSGVQPIYRSTDSGVSFTNLGPPVDDISPRAVACSADATVLYVIDQNADSIYLSVGAVQPLVKGSINGIPAPVARDPFDFIFDANNPIEYIGAGHDLAYCGGDECSANSQVASGPQGYLLVNKIAQSTTGFVGAGHDLAYCGGDSMASGTTEGSTSLKQYVIPADPTKYPYFLYIGAQTFPELATVPLGRRDEFEDLCLKICPGQQWLGILVSYT